MNTATTKRDERTIMLDIAATWAAMSNENLHGDGERSSQEACKLGVRLTHKLSELCRELGRYVDEAEAMTYRTKVLDEILSP